MDVLKCYARPEWVWGDEIASFGIKYIAINLKMDYTMN
jgi:hypothetical protein